jgi:rhomboid family GlyGly-CTERM serine protease
MTLFNSKCRSGWYFVTAMLVVMALFQFIEAPGLRYQHNWQETHEWWRLVTAHWVHVNWIHFLLNAAGLVLCLSITSPQWTVLRWLVYQIVLATGISVLFSLFNPELKWYAGYSGILYGVFILAAFDLYRRDRVISILVIAAILIKITIEQSGEINLTTSDIIGSPVIVDAHLYGVLLAMALVLVIWLNKIARTAKLFSKK